MYIEVVVDVLFSHLLYIF